MKKTCLIIAGLMLAFAGFSQPKGKPSRESIEAQRIAFITKAIDLTPEEAELFWPVYNDFEKARKNLRASKINTKKNPPQSEKEAKEMIDKHFRQQEEMLALKRKYYQKLQTVIPSTKVVKLLRAERMFKKQLVKKLRRKKRKGQKDRRRR